MRFDEAEDWWCNTFHVPHLFNIGIGIEAAATAYSLDFIPLTQERYDLVIPEATWHQPKLQAVIAIVRSHSFHAAMQALGGYETHETGQERWVC